MNSGTYYTYDLTPSIWDPSITRDQYLDFQIVLEKHGAWETPIRHTWYSETVIPELEAYLVKLDKKDEEPVL